MQETFCSCLDFCRACGRQPCFYITGGDPILHPDFWRLLGVMREHGIPFPIPGNPFLLRDEVCQRRKGYGCEKYQLSLDGLRDTHDWFRRPGSFDCTPEKPGCIHRAGLRSAVMTAVPGASVDEVAAAGVDISASARCCPAGGEKDAGIAPMRDRKLLEDCGRKSRE